MGLSHPFIQLYTLNQTHSPKANGGCSLKEHAVCHQCCTCVCPGSSNLWAKYLSNVRHLQKCRLFLQQWSGEGLLCLQPHVQKPLLVSLDSVLRRKGQHPALLPITPWLFLLLCLPQWSQPHIFRVRSSAVMLNVLKHL